MEQFCRTAALVGESGLSALRASAVAVFGLGGVGSYAAEALARAGVGTLILYDHDKIAESNINRQLYALHSTVGRLKTEVAEQRVRDINPHARVISRPVFFSAENARAEDFSGLSFVIDAVDTVTAKLLIIERASAAGVPAVSCMGTGNKLDPSRLRFADIYSTSVCPLARVMRRELRARGVLSQTVLYSDEPPIVPVFTDDAPKASGKPVPGSVSFVPSVAGLMLAGAAVRSIIGISDYV